MTRNTHSGSGFNKIRGRLEPCDHLLAALNDSIAAFEVSWRLCLAPGYAVLGARGRAPYDVESPAQFLVIECADIRYYGRGGGRVAIDAHNIPPPRLEDSPNTSRARAHLEYAHLLK